MIHAVVIRNVETEKVTAGNLFVFDDTLIIFQCKVLELPWKMNQKQISCIPAGDYQVHKDPNRLVFDILNVPNRSEIQQHVGNYTHEIRGCQLLGEAHTDIDNDGIIDVALSEKTMQRYHNLMPDSFTLKIIDV